MTDETQRIGPSDPPSPQETTDVQAGRRRHRIQMRTLVLGILLEVIAMTVVAARVLEVDVDGVTVTICALIAAGVLLLAGAAVSLRRDRRR
jgi:heme/copper-type cytochrome/quinol oxidase subunit 4